MTSHAIDESSAQELIELLVQLMQRSIHRNTLDASRGELGLIILLHQHPQGLTAGELGEKLRISSSGVANVLKQLESKGLVVRSVSTCDRRRIVVSITDKGEQIAREHCSLLTRDMAQALAELGEEDTQELIRIFRKLLSRPTPS